ncbi:MAG: BCCT family transporter [Clostridium fessum]
MAVFALLAGTTTTFTLATPLMSQIVSNSSVQRHPPHRPSRFWQSPARGIHRFRRERHGRASRSSRRPASTSSSLFWRMCCCLAVKHAISSKPAFSSIGNLVQNFIGLSTYTDPQRTTSFPQTWTMFYWAYWMVWCVAAPFFIGTISRGRTIRQTILGGYVFGLGGTFVSFIILGNYAIWDSRCSENWMSWGFMPPVATSIPQSLPSSARFRSPRWSSFCSRRR